MWDTEKSSYIKYAEGIALVTGYLPAYTFDLSNFTAFTGMLTQMNHMAGLAGFQRLPHFHAAGQRFWPKL